MADPTALDSNSTSEISIIGKPGERDAKSTPATYWTPFFLKPATLIAFAVIFICMIATLAILYVLSERHQGFSTASPRNHYLWTYGPTAGMT